MSRSRLRPVLRALALVATAMSAAPEADAATLAEARARGSFNVCAHPNALPYSSQDRTLPGFQIELAEAVARQLGLALHVQWIVFTRHARRLDCDATMGVVVRLDADAEPPRRGSRLTKPYMASGYVLVVPVASPSIARLEDLNGRKVGVEHASWPHYVLDSAKVPLASYGGPLDILEATTKGEVAAGLVPDAYARWYIRLNPTTVKVSDAYTPHRDLQWNVALGLRNADTALVDAVNQAIDSLVSNGTVATILGRYGIPHRPSIAR